MYITPQETCKELTKQVQNTFDVNIKFIITFSWNYYLYYFGHYHIEIN